MGRIGPEAGGLPPPLGPLDGEGDGVVGCYQPVGLGGDYPLVGPLGGWDVGGCYQSEGLGGCSFPAVGRGLFASPQDWGRRPGGCYQSAGLGLFASPKDWVAVPSRP